MFCKDCRNFIRKGTRKLQPTAESAFQYPVWPGKCLHAERHGKSLCECDESCELFEPSSSDGSVSDSMLQVVASFVRGLVEERDAAVADLGTNCHACLFYHEDSAQCKHPKKPDGLVKDPETKRCLYYVWRGVQK